MKNLFLFGYAFGGIATFSIVLYRFYEAFGAVNFNSLIISLATGVVWLPSLVYSVIF